MKTHAVQTDILVVCIVAVAICIGFVNGDSASKPFISIDPVSEKTVGDLLIASGTTDLTEGTRLFVTVEGGDYNTGTTVLKGTEGINRWSVPIDTTAIKPGEYLVQVNNIKSSYPGPLEFGDLTNTTKLVLTGTFLGSDTPVSGENQDNAFITINPINNRNKGEQFLVTGKTNLPVGSEILWEVKPAHLEEMTSGIATGSMANSQVTKGKNNNQVSYALDTTVLIPGEYNVTASTIRGEMFSENMVPGNISGFTLFTLK
ncbi:MAG: hypothetical protein CVV33_01100 [Methanomicrobiales archaeon HGW-Methanomicrobiales-4]|nr:MAG: hypothetical protein CVV33_01100 [Methanomicrobiales archaeon HGW-Methanomicrobiales-4]